MPPKLAQSLVEKALGLVQAKKGEMPEVDPAKDVPEEVSSTTASTAHQEEARDNGKKKERRAKKEKKETSGKGDDAERGQTIYTWDSISHLMQDFDIDLEEAKLVLTECCGPQPENWTPPGSVTKPSKKSKRKVALVPDATSCVKKPKSDKAKEVNDEPGKEPTPVATPENTPAPESAPMDPPSEAPKKKRLRKKGPEVHVANPHLHCVCVYVHVLKHIELYI